MLLLKNIFHKSDTQSHPHNPHFITEREQIIEMLQAVQEDKIVISLYFADQPGKGYASSLTKVCEGGVLLDRVCNEAGHAQLLQKKRFKALAKYEEVSVTFDCILTGVCKENGSVQYKIVLPEKIYFPQKRTVFRVKTQLFKLPIHIKAEGGVDSVPEVVVGRVEDISMGGIGFTLEPSIYVRKNDVLRFCVLRLGEDKHINFDLEVRNVKSLADGRLLRVGGRFVNLSRKTAKLIRSEVIRLERMMKKD